MNTTPPFEKPSKSKQNLSFFIFFNGFESNDSPGFHFDIFVSLFPSPYILLVFSFFCVSRERERERERETGIDMEGEDAVPADEDGQYCGWRVMSPEIVEIGEDSRSIISSRDGGFNDVYVAIGKDDLDVVKWAIDHAVSPGARVFLVHVFSPILYIPTPVGRLLRNQLSQEQVRVYANEENNRRRNLLQKYIRLCTDAKVTVDTMLIESNSTAKAILDLIPVLNITNLVMGTKRPPSSRRLMMKGMGKGEFVQKNAPGFCEVTIVYDGKKLADGQQVVPSAIASSHRRPDIARQSKRSFFGCIGVSGKSSLKNTNSSVFCMPWSM